MNNTSWKNDEKTFKMKEGLGLGVTVVRTLKDKLSSLATENGWESSKEVFEENGGMSFLLTPKSPDKENSYTNPTEFMDIIKSEFKELDEERLNIKFIPHIRWILPMIMVTFH